MAEPVSREQSVMAVSVSRDLCVMVEDTAVRKLTERQEALKKSIQKGEPKALGVSQVMVGLLIMLYSLPLLVPEFTEVMTFGVPWWSGTVFILTGAAAIVTDKHGSLKTLYGCLVSTAIGLLVSILALIIYFIDLGIHPDIEDCDQHADNCSSLATHFSRGVKSSLLLFTMVQAVICSVLTYTLYKERKCFTDYVTMDQLIPPSTTVEVI